MATTTPNYGWPVPTSSDLVKNGATAIEALGDAADATMATMVPKSIVDAKGDIIAATAADTVSRLAIGTNNQVLTADSAQATGMKWATPAAGGATFIGASAYASASQNITNATWTTITLDSELWDTDAFHSTSVNNSRFTIPAGLAGTYTIGTSMVWGTLSAVGTRIIRVIKNGNTYFYGLHENPSASNYIGNAMSVVIQGAVADYFEIQMYQSSGATAGTGSGFQDQWVQLTYIGA